MCRASGEETPEELCRLRRRDDGAHFKHSCPIRAGRRCCCRPTNGARRLPNFTPLQALLLARGRAGAGARHARPTRAGRVTSAAIFTARRACRSAPMPPRWRRAAGPPASRPCRDRDAEPAAGTSLLAIRRRWAQRNSGHHHREDPPALPGAAGGQPHASEYAVSLTQYLSDSWPAAVLMRRHRGRAGGRTPPAAHAGLPRRPDRCRRSRWRRRTACWSSCRYCPLPSMPPAPPPTCAVAGGRSAGARADRAAGGRPAGGVCRRSQRVGRFSGLTLPGSARLRESGRGQSSPSWPRAPAGHRVPGSRRCRSDRPSDGRSPVRRRAPGAQDSGATGSPPGFAAAAGRSVCRRLFMRRSVHLSFGAGPELSRNAPTGPPGP